MITREEFEAIRSLLWLQQVEVCHNEYLPHVDSSPPATHVIVVIQAADTRNRLEILRMLNRVVGLDDRFDELTDLIRRGELELFQKALLLT